MTTLMTYECRDHPNALPRRGAVLVLIQRPCARALLVRSGDGTIPHGRLGASYSTRRARCTTTTAQTAPRPSAPSRHPLRWSACVRVSSVPNASGESMVAASVIDLDEAQYLLGS